jgi:2-phospho-L-lactate transferase/gluconeogenesis factor (CofD/UPF0052 family)
MTTAARDVFRRRDRLRVVLFSGGRGSGALGRLLIRDPRIDLTIAINGYDDGASTGEVRRFLGACLGPSDFRKNASRLAAELTTAPADLIAVLDTRLPVPCDTTRARTALQALPETPHPWRPEVARRLDAFLAELDRSGRPFVFADCSVGNLVFAGSFLLAGRDFNAAVADYCAMLGLPPGLIVNVTDGTDAYLVALDTSGELLASEEAVVDAKRQNRIEDIFLIDRPLDEAEQRRLGNLSIDQRRAALAEQTTAVRVNPAIVEALHAADLIIYAPGTQHSSLFPSYLTPGLSGAIASNLSAIKLLVTNLQRDAEITGASAVDIIDRALFYLREKGRRTDPTPCLITHYLLNDPGQESTPAHVPLGAVDTLEDPRLVRIGHYEDGVTGHHDAEKILAPFVASLLGSDREPAVTVYLHDADSPNKLTQTLLEMVRAGVGDLPLSLTVVHTLPPIEASLAAALPFRVTSVAPGTALEALRTSGSEYTILFESSGMYRGDDLVALASQLVFMRLDAVWGSRRLSVKDVEEALVLRYQNSWLQKTASRFGSHVLSVLYLILFGRYISDTLSGARAVRTKYLTSLTVGPSHKLANHQLLAAVLRDRAEVLEIPVRFFPISPKRVKRTSILDGGRAMLEIVTRRFV